MLAAATDEMVFNVTKGAMVRQSSVFVACILPFALEALCHVAKAA